MILKHSVYLGNEIQDMQEVKDKYGVGDLFDALVKFDTRHVETELSQVEMAEVVLRECLEGVDKEKVGVIIFTSNMSTKCVPSTALTLVSKVGLRKKDLVAFDLNSNCSGALSALNVAKELVKEDELAVVVAVDKFTMVENEESPITHSYGDAATCMVIDKYFDDYHFSQDNNTEYIEEMQLPYKEMVKGQNDMVMVVVGSPSFEEVMSLVGPQFEKVCKAVGKSKEEFFAFNFTQGSGKIIEGVSEILQLNKEKVPFTGKETGYAGVCCPLINLDYLVKNRGLKRGDLLFFWSLGAGVNSTMCVFRY